MATPSTALDYGSLADLQSLAFLAVTIPALVALALAVYRPAAGLRTAREGRPTRRPIASSAAG